MNPIESLKNIQHSIPNPASMMKMARTQSEQIKVQIQENQKQTVILNAWAHSAEKQAIALEKIAKILEKKFGK